MDYSTILSSCNIACQKIILIFRQLQRRITRNLSCNFTRIPRLFGGNRRQNISNISGADGNGNSANNGTRSVRTNNNIHNIYDNNNNNINNNSNNDNDNDNNNNYNNNSNNINNNNNNNNNSNTRVINSTPHVTFINNLSICKNYLISFIVQILFSTKNQIVLSMKIISGLVKNSNLEIRKVIMYILRILKLRR